MKDPNKKLLTALLPKDLHKKFKGLCGNNSTNMTSIAVELVSAWVSAAEQGIDPEPITDTTDIVVPTE